MDKWLSHPTAIKVISLMIGILMWAVVHFDSDKTPNTVANLTETQEIDAVQVKPIGMDDKNFALRLLDPGAVHLTVRGSRSDFLIAQAGNDYEVTVDLSQAVEGRKVLPVKVNLPKGLELIDVSPSNVTVVLERIVTKEFEVSIKTEGTPGKGYKIGQPVVKPNNRVHVTLPKDQMSLVDSVGGTLSVEGEEETVNDKKMKLVAYDKEGNELTDAIISPSVVEVEIPITKPFKKLPLQIGFRGSLPEGYAMSSFSQSVDQITVYGPQDVLDKYDYYDGITVDLSKLKESGTMELDIPPMEGIANVDPQKVSFEYKIVLAETKVMSHLPVKMIGLSEGLNAKVTLPPNGMVDAIVKGASNVLAQLESKDVQLIADLTGLGPGSHVVPLEMHLPQFVEQAPNAPITVTVEITDSTATIAQPDTENGNGVPATDETDAEAPSGDGSGTGADTDSGVNAPSGEGAADGAEEKSSNSAATTP
ncbi:CdaR family protein [Paenibacillus silvisoli]|uniref:CdaR family protein n=1 Tax=Paenibacillus silvisoli TaxID=3110539 RepID=UPI00280587B4|nr:CdaR family protein [Paenibacillus silvisoli]